ncbi:hypothetical protein ABZ760_21140 [Streptomyces sp. NPDC006658]|uniref:hypothetical protein n=1 Tax=Streptomyces sp. NPDC006658 TaxID=3156900 RepID=UPI0034076435
MQHHTMIPPVDRRTFGHAAFAVQAAQDTRERADQLPAESADRYIAHAFPAVAALLADDDHAHKHGTQLTCPDGVRFCQGYPSDHEVPGDHLNMGPITAMHGPYVGSQEGIAGFHLRQIQGEQPVIEFVGDGSWPALDLADVDRLGADLLTHHIALKVARRQLADMLTSARTPLDEPEDEQTAHAAFSLAAEALAVALEKSPDREATLAAMRSLVNLHAAEVHA